MLVNSENMNVVCKHVSHFESDVLSRYIILSKNLLRRKKNLIYVTLIASESARGACNSEHHLRQLDIIVHAALNTYYT